MEKSLNIKYVLIAIIIVLAILFLYKKQENLDASGLSNEALQNIAKVNGNIPGVYYGSPYPLFGQKNK